MPTLTAAHSNEAARSGPAMNLPGWLREPLVHFLILGAILFAADHFIVDRTSDARTIIVGSEVDVEANRLFSASRGRAPNAAELAALRQVWLDNELLFREGLALQVDKGDQGIRDRVIFKALSIIEANLKLPPADEKVLREWFDKHRNKYDEPGRYDFQEAVLVGDNSEAAVRRFVDTLNANTSGDAKADLRVFKGRPRSNLLQSYGDPFTKALEASPVGVWRAQQTKDGWRAILLNAISAPRPATFEAVAGAVRQDWTDATMAEVRTAAVRSLGKKYAIKYESGK